MVPTLGTRGGISCSRNEKSNSQNVMHPITRIRNAYCNPTPPVKQESRLGRLTFHRHILSCRFVNWNFYGLLVNDSVLMPRELSWFPAFSPRNITFGMSPHMTTSFWLPCLSFPAPCLEMLENKTIGIFAISLKSNDSHKPFHAKADLVQWKTIRHGMVLLQGPH